MKPYELALYIYYCHPNTPETPSGAKLQPSVNASVRSDADNAWHLRDKSGWLATVFDHGDVQSVEDDHSEDYEWWLERLRGTAGEIELNASSAEAYDEPRGNPYESVGAADYIIGWVVVPENDCGMGVGLFPSDEPGPVSSAAARAARALTAKTGTPHCVWPVLGLETPQPGAVTHE